MQKILNLVKFKWIELRVKKFYKGSPQSQNIMREHLHVKGNSLFGEFSFLVSFQTEIWKWYVRK